MAKSNPENLQELVEYLEQRAKENGDHARAANDNDTIAWHSGKRAAYQNAAYKVRQMIPPEYPKAVCFTDVLVEDGVHGFYRIPLRAFKVDSKEYEYKVRRDHEREQKSLSQKRLRYFRDETGFVG